MSLFSIKKPCKDCPFRKDGNMLESLGEGRMNEIVKNVVEEDGFFPCHKTIDYDRQEEGEQGLQPSNKFCAGALIAIDKAGANRDNLNTRLALWMDLYKVEELQDTDCIINPDDYLGCSRSR